MYCIGCIGWYKLTTMLISRQPPHGTGPSSTVPAASPLAELGIGPAAIEPMQPGPGHGSGPKNKATSPSEIVERINMWLWFPRILWMQPVYKQGHKAKHQFQPVWMENHGKPWKTQPCAWSREAWQRQEGRLGRALWKSPQAWLESAESRVAFRQSTLFWDAAHRPRKCRTTQVYRVYRCTAVSNFTIRLFHTFQMVASIFRNISLNFAWQRIHTVQDIPRFYQTSSDSVSNSVLGKVVLDVQNLQHCLGFSHALHCAGPVLLQINADLQREIWKKSLPTGPSEPPKFHICHWSPPHLASNTLSTLNKEISSNILVSSHIQCFIWKVRPLQICI